jgi:hypothetical protein
MNKHAEVTLSFDRSGMPAGVVGARSGSDAGSFRIGQYASQRLDLFTPPLV